MKVEKINIVHKMTIHVTNMFKIYVDVVIRTVFPLKKGVYGEFGLCNPKQSCNAPYFLRFSDYIIRKNLKLIFPPYNKGKHQFGL